MRRLIRLCAIALGWTIVILAAGLLTARPFGVTQITLVAFLVGIPFAALPTALATALFAGARSRVGFVTALALTLILAGIQVPQFVAEGRTANGPEITVMTINAAHGEADADAIVDQVRTSGADILAVQELTGAQVEALTSAGIDELLPYNSTEPRPVADGSGLWSRTPLTDATTLSGFEFAQVQANTTVDGVDLTVVSFHAMSPATPRHTVQWAEDLARMRGLMDSYPGTVIVAGDFNATSDHRQFRDLASDGFVDSADVAGSGLYRTFPSQRPLARLDHVVTSDTVDATEVGPVAIPDSDHLAVTARLQLPAA